MIEIACREQKPVRIGVNWGSLDQDLMGRLMDENSRLPQPKRYAQQVMRDALVASALESAALAEDVGLPGDKIILSCKGQRCAGPDRRVQRPRARCDYPLHLGLTEAGMGSKGDRRLNRRNGHPAAAGHRRHHPRLADPGARR